jgi:UDP-2,3-diacylglucosamine pyrophosphatase LpxH
MSRAITTGSCRCIPPRAARFVKFSVFPEIRIRRDAHGVVANHGHFTDPYSFEVGDPHHPDLERDFLRPSISDALLSEIMCRLPGEAGGLIGGDEGRRIEMALHEVETIRPLTKVPQWIQSYVRRVKYADIVSECWERLSKGFFNVPFVRQWMRRHDSCLNPVDDADRLEYALKLPAYLSLDWLSSIGKLSLIAKLAETVTDADEALREAQAEFRRPGSDSVRHVVLGHTHRPAMMPVNLDEGGARFYMNVGTWRKVQEEVSFPSKGREFTSFRILTYAVFHDRAAGDGSVAFQLWSCAAGGR